jgi:dTDP-4-amino-4,6-dideoxygalactose transaminase
MGASWNGRKSGTFGTIGCFSTQTYKHINSGEGGLLITNDEELMAKAIMHSGSYMLYDRHLAGPGKETFEKIRFETPNYSGRMDNLRAAILRPQLRNLDRQCERWNELYKATEEGLRNIEGVCIPQRPQSEYFVGSSIQFSLPHLSREAFTRFIQRCEENGVVIKWFGDPDPKGYTSRFDSWHYLDETPSLPKTESVLETMCDMRLPLTFDVEDCRVITTVISETLRSLKD